MGKSWEKHGKMLVIEHELYIYIYLERRLFFHEEIQGFPQ